MKNFNQSVILVAGGSGGIGSAIIKKLLPLNAKVIGISRSENIQLKNFIEKNNYEYHWFKTDLTIASSWETLINKIYTKHGKIDVLINSVGILIPGKFENLTSFQIEKIISTDLTSFICAARTIIPYMKRQGYGHIINLGSLGGIIPMPYESIYSATKFAIRGFSLSLMQELKGTGINVSLISPGPVLTEMLKKESLDENSTIAFVNKPLSADLIADKIVQTISHPKPEIVFPTRIKLISLLLNLFPSLFFKVYPILNCIGKTKKNKTSPYNACRRDSLYEC